MNFGLIVSSDYFWPVLLAYLSAVALVAEWLLTDRNRIEKRLREEGRVRLRQKAHQSRLFKDWKVAEDGAEDSSARWLERWQLFADQAGLNWNGWKLLQFSLWSAGLVALLVIPLHLGTAWSAGLSLAAFCIPSVYAVQRRNQRINTLRDQLPETFDLMSRAIESGQTISGAFQLVSTQCGGPIAKEFQHCCQQQNLGLPYEITLRDLARRTGVMELQMFAVALIVQRQAGGDPSDVLKNLAEAVRNRIKLAMKVKAITSEGRAQAWVLSALPFVSFGGIYLLDRNYASVLLERPNVMAIMAVSIALGIAWIRQIVCIEY